MLPSTVNVGLLLGTEGPAETPTSSGVLQLLESKSAGL